jgi:hypothetical protein
MDPLSSDRPTLSRSLIRRAENTELSVGSLEAIAQIRGYLDRLETEAVRSAVEKGATVEDIAEALGLTRQAIYYRLRRDRQGPTKRGRPRAAERT